MLTQALQLLATDYETQIKLFPDFVHIPDELALTYHDCFLLADQIKSAGLIRGHHVVKLEELDGTLEQMGEKEHLWTLEALKDSSEWHDIRMMASVLLALLGKEKQSPTLNWITYIRGDASTKTRDE